MTDAQKKLSWSSATILMKKPTNPQQAKEHDLVMALSKAFDIPPQGINILKDKPYINTVGLEWKLSQHPDAIKMNGVKHIKIYKEVGDIAIAKAYGTKENGENRTAIGTAGVGNMSIIKGYPNELAETRAQNRLLRRVLISHMYGDLIQNLANMKGQERTQIIDTVTASDFGAVSLEEMNLDDSGTTPEVMLTESDMKAIAPMLSNLNNAQNQEDLDIAAQKVKEIQGLNEKQLEKLRTTFANVRKALKLV